VSTPEIRAGIIVRGPTLPEPIEVLAVVPFGQSLKVIGRGLNTGLTHDPVLNPAQLLQLEISAEREPFDGNARLFRLGVEAHRLGLAYEYDPFFSLSIARVDPLPHQLEAVVSAETRLEDVDFELLDTDYWRAYARQRKFTRPISEAMFHVGLARRDNHDKLRPTRAAVLLFAEDPSGVMAAKTAIRIFHYRGTEAGTDPNTNLVRKPVTVGGPLIRQITDAKQAVINELAEKVQYGPFGFEIVQRYPVRVIAEAITNAVIHRDYRLIADVMIRVFSDRIEVESPGLLPGTVTVANIQTVRHNRNPLIVQHLREFPDPPNLDAHEGVKMMFGTMHEAGLYPPQFLTRPRIEREAVVVHLRNQNQPTVWRQVSHYLDENGSISNAEVREIRGTDDRIRASRQLKEWVDLGLLIVANPGSAKKIRRYKKPDVDLDKLFAMLVRK
jgi:ATP-dependent DNA helicase RecG